jgi:hypothetical protein
MQIRFVKIYWQCFVEWKIIYAFLEINLKVLEAWIDDNTLKKWSEFLVNLDHDFSIQKNSNETQKNLPKSSTKLLAEENFKISNEFSMNPLSWV